MPITPTAEELHRQAADAAMAVFERSLKLMAPHRHLVEEAVTAARGVYAAANPDELASAIAVSEVEASEKLARANSDLRIINSLASRVDLPADQLLDLIRARTELAELPDVNIVTIRRYDADNIGIFVDGQQIFSVSNHDADGSTQGEPSITWAAQKTAEAIALALGAGVRVETPA